MTTTMQTAITLILVLLAAAAFIATWVLSSRHAGDADALRAIEQSIGKTQDAAEKERLGKLRDSLAAESETLRRKLVAALSTGIAALVLSFITRIL